MFASNRSHHLLLPAFLLLALLFLAGCEIKPVPPEKTPPEAESPQTPIIEDPSYDPIQRGEALLFHVTNPLTETHDHREEPGKSDEYLVRVRGFSNREHQGDINATIQSLHDGLRETTLFPFRGILQMLSEESVPRYTYQNTYITLNANNLLSVTSMRSLDYPAREGRSSLFVEAAEAVTLDLENNRILRLQDLFDTNTDYLALLDSLLLQQVRSSSDWDGDHFALITPFQGLSEDQSFYLSESAIVLLIDYRNPEFQTNFTTARVSIPYRELGDALVIAPRFRDTDTEIYANPQERTHVLIRYPENVEEITGSVTTSQEQDVFRYVSISYPANLPEGPRKDIETMMEKGNLLYERYVGIGLKQGTSHQEISSRRIGPYLQISGRASIFGKLEGSEFVREHAMTRLYDSNYQRVELEDLFVEGFPWKTLVADTAKEQVGMDRWQEMETRFWNPLEFLLLPDGIVLIVNPEVEEDTEYQTTAYIYLSNEDLGVENLVYFAN